MKGKACPINTPGGETQAADHERESKERTVEINRLEDVGNKLRDRNPKDQREGPRRGRYLVMGGKRESPGNSKESQETSS